MLFLLYSKVNEFYICVHMYIYTCVHAKSLQLCPTLYNSMDCSLPGSSVHGILQARIQDGLPCPPPGALPNPGIEPESLMSPPLASGFFTTSTA